LAALAILAVQFRRQLRSSVFICGCFASAAGAQPVSVTDDAGRTVTLPRPAQRIVAIAPALAEMAFAAGAGSRLVGVARYSALPPGVPVLPEVGDAVRVDLERIVLLKPDLVLAWQSGNRTGDYERLEKLGYPVFVTESRRLDDVTRTLRAIGDLAGTRAEAGRAAAEFERGIRQLRERYAKARPVRLFYVIWTKPFMTVSGAHIISDVIALCGGENVFADVLQLTPTVSLEAIIAAKPEAILGGGSAGGERAFGVQWREAAPQPLMQLPAFYIEPDTIQRQTPRILEGAKAVCSALEKVRSNRQDAKK
jgi:iron complex transport system substrate-binding protein